MCDDVIICVCVLYELYELYFHIQYRGISSSGGEEESTTFWFYVEIARAARCLILAKPVKRDGTDSRFAVAVCASNLRPLSRNQAAVVRVSSEGTGGSKPYTSL